MKKEVFINIVNKLRLDNKNKWFYASEIVEGKTVALKGFGTWLQIYIIDGVDYSNPMERSIKQFKEDLALPFEATS